MIHHSVQQGSAEWHELRATIPTASNFDKLITPAKWEPTKGETRRSFMLQLLANRIYGLSPEDQFSSSAMEHGREWEPIARAAYEFEHNVEIQDGGFFTDDTASYGCSPDGLVGDEGMVEFKNPEGPKVHLSALLDNIGYEKEFAAYPMWTAQITNGSMVSGFVRDHWIQAQGQLLVTKRSWCDLVSNFARLPMAVVRIYPNPLFQDLLGMSLDRFFGELRDITEYAKERGWYRPKVTPVVQDGLDSLGITDDDVDAILAARGRS